MSYSRNRTYSTNKKTREVSKLTTVGYVVFIENGESLRRYLPPVPPSYFNIENNSTYFDIEAGSEYYGTE
jgi:hypothetical protein